MKIISLMIIGFYLAGCGVNCSGEPPKRAYSHQGGGYGMQYHISLYPPYASLSHALKCNEYEYLVIHIYTDDLGDIRGDRVIWKNNDGYDIPFDDNGDSKENITLMLSQKQIVVTGFKNNRDNGTYKVDDGPPDSWGVPIN